MKRAPHPALSGNDLPPAGTQADSFHRLAEAICHHRVVSLLVGGVRHDEQEPYRLDFTGISTGIWSSVAGEPSGVPGWKTLSRPHQSKPSSPERISSLITEEGFISALPHFSLYQ